MALDNWVYGNPETVAIRRQESALRKLKECGQCVHKRSIEFQGEMHYACEYKRRVFGKRCELFETKRGNND